MRLLPVFADDARAVASALDRMPPAELRKLPLAGVPIAIKDTTDVAGRRTTFGSRALRENISAGDAVVVERLRRAGAIIIGKTTTPEFGTSRFTESALFGITRNPRDLSRTPGGSSGGSAAAVVAGCVPLAEGTDAGGSVRIPAALCGCIGFKPSFGLIPMATYRGGVDLFWHHGPLARTVEDVALFVAVCAGPDDRDWLSLPMAFRKPRLGGHLKGWRVALSIDLGVFSVRDDVAQNTLEAARCLRDLGAHVTPVELGWTPELIELTDWEFAAFVASEYGELADAQGDLLSEKTHRLIRLGRGLTAMDLKHAQAARLRLWQGLARVFVDHDALICPTTARTAPPVDFDEAELDKRDATGRIVTLDMTVPFSVNGVCPALSIPSGVGSDGLPTALQIVGPRYADGRTLQLAGAYERATSALQANLRAPIPVSASCKSGVPQEVQSPCTK